MSFKNRVFNELTCTKYLKKKTIFPFIPRVSTTIFLMNRTDFSQNFWLEKTYAEKCIVMKLYYFLLFLSINWKKKNNCVGMFIDFRTYTFNSNGFRLHFWKIWFLVIIWMYSFSYIFFESTGPPDTGGIDDMFFYTRKTSKRFCNIF